MTISAHDIEKDLADLWKQSPDEKAKGPGLQKVYTTNLVAYASGHDEGYRVEQILNDLAEEHPGRYILIRPAADPAEPPLRHYVSGHCYFEEGREKRVCCDLIKLVAQKDVIENLYGFTFSLLLTDLPVEFWWPGDLPYDNVFFDKMAEEATRVWVDSSKFKEPIRSLARLSAFWEKRYHPTILADLNWVRIQRWRSLISELFDGEWAKYLKDIRQVTIEYGEGSQPMRSVFLACWLAIQLGWKYKGPRLSSYPSQLDFEKDGKAVQVLLKPVPVPDPKSDRIFAVGLVTDGPEPGIFTVVRDEDPHFVIARSEVGHKLAFSRTVTFEHLHTNELLHEGLKHQEPDPVWSKVLILLGGLLEKPDLTQTK